MDHAIDRVGQLASRTKEAETILHSPQEEREMATRIHDAVRELRNEELAS